VKRGSDGIGEHFHQHAEEMKLDLRKGDDVERIMYTFFLTQWHNPCKGDWTEQVKEDLADFKIQCSFEEIERRSKESFKKTSQN
jgi:hypothetical protein